MLIPEHWFWHKLSTVHTQWRVRHGEKRRLRDRTAQESTSTLTVTMTRSWWDCLGWESMATLWISWCAAREQGLDTSRQVSAFGDRLVNDEQCPTLHRPSRTLFPPALCPFHLPRVVGSLIVQLHSSRGTEKISLTVGRPLPGVMRRERGTRLPGDSWHGHYI